MVVEDAAGGRVDEHGSKPPRGPRQPREEAGLGGGGRNLKLRAAPFARMMPIVSHSRKN